MMDYFWGHYFAPPEDGRHPHASPIKAESLAGLPPAMVITAECDPIRDQGEAYAQLCASSACLFQSNGMKARFTCSSTWPVLSPRPSRPSKTRAPR
jgi:acetyl esterase